MVVLVRLKLVALKEFFLQCRDYDPCQEVKMLD